MDKLINFLVVGLGGAAGSMLRYGVTLLFAFLHLSGNLATFSVNVIGSFLIGILTGCCKEGTLLLLLTVGLCGGFTTFSTFSLQSVRLIQGGNLWEAAIYIIGTLVMCVAAAWLGYLLGKA